MIRIMKKYTLNFKTSQAKSVAMSSYPGNVFSTDDYYITSQNMVVQETSIENFNSSMWKGLNATNFVFEFIRNTVANRLATSGAEWATVFSRLNSGTYNNQFMIVDYKRLENKTVQPGLLTVLEQMPNLIVYADMSEHLKEHTYWYNTTICYNSHLNLSPFVFLSPALGLPTMCPSSSRCTVKAEMSKWRRRMTSTLTTRPLVRSSLRETTTR